MPARPFLSPQEAGPVASLVAGWRLHGPRHIRWFDLDTGALLAGLPPQGSPPGAVPDVEDAAAYAAGRRGGVVGIRRSRFERSRRMTLVNGILVFVVLIVVLQLCLLTATMNAFLGGGARVTLPAAAASPVCVGLTEGLLRYLRRLD